MSMELRDFMTSYGIYRGIKYQIISKGIAFGFIVEDHDPVFLFYSAIEAGRGARAWINEAIKEGHLFWCIFLVYYYM